MITKADVMNEIVSRVNAFDADVKAGLKDPRQRNAFMSELVEELCKRYEDRFTRDTICEIWERAIKYFKH